MTTPLATDQESLEPIQNWLKKNRLSIPLEKIKTAFVHRSYAHEKSEKHLHNERLEFLGDSVISIVVAYHLYKKFPDSPEGVLSRWKSQIVSARELGKLSRELGIGDCLLLGVGELRAGGRKRNSLLCNTLEAVVGAIFEEKGFLFAQKWVLKILQPRFEEIESGAIIEDHKTSLQERVQKTMKVCPTYSQVSAEGPEHARVFEMQVMIGEKAFGSGTGRNKKEAEQAAALKTLQMLSDEDLTPPANN